MDDVLTQLAYFPLHLLSLSPPRPRLSRQLFNPPRQGYENQCHEVVPATLTSSAQAGAFLSPSLFVISRDVGSRTCLVPSCWACAAQYYEAASQASFDEKGALAHRETAINRHALCMDYIRSSNIALARHDLGAHASPLDSEARCRGTERASGPKATAWGTRRKRKPSHSCRREWVSTRTSVPTISILSAFLFSLYFQCGTTFCGNNKLARPS